METYFSKIYNTDKSLLTELNELLKFFINTLMEYHYMVTVCLSFSAYKINDV